MTDIKRPRYFRYQFLLEKDFTDEQAYHRQTRHLQNQYLRLPGVVKGMNVEQVGPKEVRVLPGMAIDDNGQEIIIPPESPPLSVPLSDFGSSIDVYIAIQYSEKDDPTSEAEIGGSTVYTRVLQQATALGTTSDPASSPELVTLAKVSLDGSGNITGPIDFTNRQESSADIADNAIDTAQLADNAVISAKLKEADGSTGQDTNAGSGVKTAHLQDGAVSDPKLRDNSVLSVKIKEADGSTDQNTNTGSGVKTNHIQDSAVTLNKLADNSVNASKIVVGSIGPKELADGAVNNSKLGNNSVNSSKIIDGSIMSEDLADGAVTNAKLGNNSVNSSKIIDASILSSDLANGSVTNSKLANNAVTGLKISNATISQSKLDTATNTKINNALPNTGGTISGSLEMTGASLATYRRTSIFRNGVNRLAMSALVGATGSAGTPTFTGGLGVWVTSPADARGIFVHHTNTTGYALYINRGKAYFGGAKEGYVVDRFINGSGKKLHTGDVVKLKSKGDIKFAGDRNKIPIVEITLADKENDPAVIGIVDDEAPPLEDQPDQRVQPEDPTFVAQKGEVYVVSLGAYAHCKVDATVIPVDVGDLLTTSAKPGCAQKASEPKVGSIIGKALEPIKESVGYISVFVNIQ